MRQSGAVAPDPAATVARLTRWADDLQRRRSVLGFPYAVVKKYGDDGGGREAALVTYYGFLSIFPTLLLLVWGFSIALAHDTELRDDLIDNLVPADLAPTVTAAVAALPTSGVPLVIGLLGLLFSGTGVVMSVYVTLNHLAGVPHRERFDFFPRYARIFAVLVVVLLSAVAVAVLGLLPSVAAQIPALSEVMARAGVSVLVLAVGSAIVIFVMLLVCVRLLVCRPVRVAAVWPGALLGAVIGTVVLAIGAQVLTVLVQKAGAVYGTFATVVGLFSLLYLVSQGLVYSAEVAIVRRRRLWPRALDSSRPTAADRQVLTALGREQERIPRMRVTTAFVRRGGRS